MKLLVQAGQILPFEAPVTVLTRPLLPTVEFIQLLVTTLTQRNINIGASLKLTSSQSHKATCFVSLLMADNSGRRNTPPLRSAAEDTKGSQTLKLCLFVPVVIKLTL